MSEATSGPLNPRLAALMRATAFGSIRQRLLDLVESGCFVVLAPLWTNHEQVRPYPPHPHLSLRGMVPFDWQIGRTNPSKHILAERTQTHRERNRSATRILRKRTHFARKRTQPGKP